MCCLAGNTTMCAFHPVAEALKRIEGDTAVAHHTAAAADEVHGNPELHRRFRVSHLTNHN
jgi:hypothetical protein